MAKGRFEAKGGAPTITGLIILVVLLGAVAAGVTALWNGLRKPAPAPEEPADRGAVMQEQTQETKEPKKTKKKSKKQLEEEQRQAEEAAAREAEEAELRRKEQRRDELMAEARNLRDGYYYDKALTLLSTCPVPNDETQKLIADIRNRKDSLVKYEGDQYYHIFFHSLIADPAKAFDGDYDSDGYDLYMTTVSEFKAMLPLLEEAGFILYDITDMVKFVDGQAVMQDIYLPEGKKPLVLSIDDVNYYEYMSGDGFAERMDVDAEGNIVTVVDGVPTYDGDVMPILDQYVKEHPAFSWQGAKGIVAITGYEGAFGYRITDLEMFDEKTQKWMLEKTQTVAKALRDTGWQIACHSYTHNNYWGNLSITMDQEQYDIGRWLRDIAPYVGGSNIFIAPFGVSFGSEDSRFRYLVDNGFNIYCSVDSAMPCYVRDDFFLQGRLNLDGLVMKQYPGRISRFFFDPAEVLDPARP